MRLVHLADLHLGYRQYQRLTPGGVNQREADVAATFRTAIDRIIALQPDVVVVAGDIFHSARPTNQAILHALIELTRLREELPNAIILLVAGGHDTPRASEMGGILRLFAQLGFNVVDRRAERVNFADHDLSILAVPDVPGLVRPALTPDSSAQFNVLVVHGMIEGVLPASAAMADRASVAIPREDLELARWDYVALGHYHVYREIAPNAYYSGSIDYTSVNTWGELYEQRVSSVRGGGKGFIERDLASGRHTFHPLPASRPLVDLPPISATGLSAAELDARLSAIVGNVPGGIDDKIVRATIRDIPRHIGREMDHRPIRDFKRRALNFQLDLVRPDVRHAHGSGAPGRRPSLNEMVREKLLARPLDAEIDRAALVDRAMKYLDEAQAIVPATALVEL